jgi:hypothetical protein
MRLALTVVSPATRRWQAYLFHHGLGICLHYVAVLNPQLGGVA